MFPELFNRDYFENGVETGVSCYQQFKWMPEMSLKMAHNLISFLALKKGDAVLDYGCSKGFLVKALRILDIDAHGCDISKYAINHADEEIRYFCGLINEKGNIPFKKSFKCVISKDVAEHMSEKSLYHFLQEVYGITHKLFMVIPLANVPGEFVIPAYHLDKTHIQIQPVSWWDRLFLDNGWKITDFRNNLPGVKDNYTINYPDGNGFWTLERV